ncbi:hypothetical protein I4U23_004270 [Adineta vaga]|nr:hypothetical protein I4U23_004270 [Adineta vaga]
MLLSFVLCTCLTSIGTSFSISNETILFNFTLPQLNNVEHVVDSAPTTHSFASGTVNTNILTLFKYNGSQIYVYGSVSNEDDKPQKWIFYYVPVMAPLQILSTDTWVWSTKNEIRIKLLLGDDTIEEMARKAIAKKYDMQTAEYAKYWDVAPLMIDSLTAYIVQGSSSPIAGVEPFRAVHPNALVMIFRFKCSTEENARQIAEMIRIGEYEIEVAFYFAGFRQTSTSFISITGDQLKAAASKTTADGENTNAQYIHRDQASKFIGKYIMNIKKLIYSENPAINAQALSDGLEAQFLSLLQQAMQDSTMEKLRADALQQVWSPSDLDPDVLETDINKMFSYNQSETERHNDSKMYFNGNVETMKQSAAKGSGSLSASIGISFLKIFSLGLSGSGESAPGQFVAGQFVAGQFVADNSSYRQFVARQFVARTIRRMDNSSSDNSSQILSH